MESTQVSPQVRGSFGGGLDGREWFGDSVKGIFRGLKFSGRFDWGDFFFIRIF